jgi:hypothetical protein
LKVGHRLRVLQSWVLRETFGSNWEEVIGGSLMLCEPHPLLCWDVVGGPCGTVGIREMHTGIWRRNLKKGDHLEDLGIDGSTVSKRILKEWDERAWNQAGYG